MKVAAIELDASIQCRADIDIATVNEYAEAMRDGAEFPPVVLFGTESKCWIGDGWHRVMAAKSIGREDIAANLQPGGRMDALKAALSANAVHGRRRTNADKRCAVAIALREFGKMSDRTIAEMCAVSHTLVENMRRALSPSIGNECQSRTTSDGRQYPAYRKPAPTPAPAPTPVIGQMSSETTLPEVTPERIVGPPCVGMQFARIAIMKLSEIRQDDLEREQAFQAVERWISEHT